MRGNITLAPRRGFRERREIEANLAPSKTVVLPRNSQLHRMTSASSLYVYGPRKTARERHDLRGPDLLRAVAPLRRRRVTH